MRAEMEAAIRITATTTRITIRTTQKREEAVVALATDENERHCRSSFGCVLRS